MASYKKGIWSYVIEKVRLSLSFLVAANRG